MLGARSQSVAKRIAKCVRDYKVWQGGLQSLAGWITKCSNSGLKRFVRWWITKCGKRDYKVLGIAKCGSVDYKVHQGLQSVAGLQSELVRAVPCF